MSIGKQSTFDARHEFRIRQVVSPAAVGNCRAVSALHGASGKSTVNIDLQLRRWSDYGHSKVPTANERGCRHSLQNHERSVPSQRNAQAIARYGSHKPFARKPVEINALVRNTLDAIKDYVVAERTAVEIILGSQVPEIPADASRIEQVLINLVKNAVEAMGSMPPEDRYIAITTRFSQPYVEISVKDTGPMLTALQTDGMLEPCQSQKPFGMGIGLWISHQIIQKHDGELELRPADPQGLEVLLRLPCIDQ